MGHFCSGIIFKAIRHYCYAISFSFQDLNRLLASTPADISLPEPVNGHVAAPPGRAWTFGGLCTRTDQQKFAQSESVFQIQAEKELECVLLIK